MTKKDDGGPAFPGPMMPDVYLGMSLRDYFAGQALVGILAGYWGNADMSGLGPKEMADAAYEQADAMLEARK